MKQIFYFHKSGDQLMLQTASEALDPISLNLFIEQMPLAKGGATDLDDTQQVS